MAPHIPLDEKVHLDGYVDDGFIGSGGFGVVRRVRCQKDGNLYACKILDGETTAKELLQEIEPIQHLDIDYVIKIWECRIIEIMHSSGVQHRRCYIVMDLCRFSLRDEIEDMKSRGGRYSEERCWLILTQLIVVLHHLAHPGEELPCLGLSIPEHAWKRKPTSSRKCNILHRDLKADNILFDSYMRIKVTDFGLSRYIGSESQTRSRVGTPQYGPPEVLFDHGYTGGGASDIWAAAATIVEMWLLELPPRVMGNIPIDQFTLNCSADLRDILASMLSFNPECRPSAAQLARDPRFLPHMRSLALSQYSIKIAETSHNSSARLQDLLARAHALSAVIKRTTPVSISGYITVPFRPHVQ